MTVFTQTVSAGGNDGTYDSGGGFSLTGTNIRVGEYAFNYRHLIARFTSVTIPNGATISSATIDVNVLNNSGITKLISKCGAADNAAMPASYSDANTAAKTTGTTSTVSFANNSGYNSVTITAEVQAVVNRAGWASGNAMVVYFMDNTSTAGNYTQVKTFEDGGATAPRLTITYTAGGGGGGSSSPPGPAINNAAGFSGNRRAFHAGGLNLGGF